MSYVGFSKIKKSPIQGTHFDNELNGDDILEADNLFGFIQAAGYLKYIMATEYNVGLAYRGQNKIYPSMLASLYHETKTVKARQAKNRLFNELIKNIKLEITENTTIRQKNASIEGYLSVQEKFLPAILQHYGIQTPWLDLVDNLWVALWFACHKAIRQGQYTRYEKRIDTQNDFCYIVFVRIPIAQDEKIPYLFIDKNSEVVDLRNNLPSLFLRPHAQHGLILHNLNKNAWDMSDLVEATIRIKLSNALKWLGEGELLSTGGLFPSPVYDLGMQKLLRINCIKDYLEIPTP